MKPLNQPKKQTQTNQICCPGGGPGIGVFDPDMGVQDNYLTQIARPGR